MIGWFPWCCWTGAVWLPALMATSRRVCLAISNARSALTTAKLVCLGCRAPPAALAIFLLPNAVFHLLTAQLSFTPTPTPGHAPPANLLASPACPPTNAAAACWDTPWRTIFATSAVPSEHTTPTAPAYHALVLVLGVLVLSDAWNAEVTIIWWMGGTTECQYAYRGALRGHTWTWANRFVLTAA